MLVFVGSSERHNAVSEPVNQYQATGIDARSLLEKTWRAYVII
jgi:hypothetical protein